MPTDTRSEIRIRRWRIQYIEGGVLLFFDPRRESVVLLDGPHPEFHYETEPDRLEQEVQMMLWGDD